MEQAIDNRTSKPEVFFIVSFLILSIVLVVVAFSVTRSSDVTRIIALLFVPSIYLLARVLFKDRVSFFSNSLMLPLLVIATATTTYALSFTPGSVPDEISHYKVAYAYANLLSPGYAPENMRAEDLDFYNEFNIIFTWDKFEHISSAPLLCKDKQLVVYDGLINQPLWGNENGSEELGLSYILSTSPPYLKIGSAVGIALGRLFGFSGATVFYLGRLGNIAFCCMLIGLALYLTPIGQEAMTAVALLPMSIHVIGSLSNDGPVLGLCFIGIALLLRLVLQDARIGKTEVACTCLVLILLGPCKLVYSLISLLALFIPSSRFVNRKQEVLLKGALVLSPYAGIILLRLGKVMSLLLGSSTTKGEVLLDRRLNETGTFYTVKDLIAHPRHTYHLFIDTLRLNGRFYLYSMVGTSLAQFQPDISNDRIAPLLYALLLLCALPADKSRSDSASGWFDTTCVLLFFAVFFAIVLAEALIWTFNTEDIIQGVQGRYLLPVLPLLLVPLTRLKPIGNLLHEAIALIFCFVDVAYLVSIFATLCTGLNMLHGLVAVP